MGSNDSKSDSIKNPKVHPAVLPVALSLVILLWSITFLVILASLLTPDSFGIITEAIARAGTLGDSFGAVNSLFTGLAFALLVYTSLLQRQELSLQRQALVDQQQEIQKHVSLVDRQIHVLESREAPLFHIDHARCVFKGQFARGITIYSFKLCLRNFGEIGEIRTFSMIPTRQFELDPDDALSPKDSIITITTEFTGLYPKNLSIGYSYRDITGTVRYDAWTLVSSIEIPDPNNLREEGLVKPELLKRGVTGKEFEKIFDRELLRIRWEGDDLNKEAFGIDKS